MIKYSNFLFSIIFRRISTYISIFFCLLVSFIIIYLLIKFSNNAEISKIGIFPITTFSVWFSFVFSIMFITLMIIRIFKIGEIDGTDLLISAKPFTRRQIIFGKFLVLFTMILMLHIFLFVTYILTALADNQATSKQRILFATSMTLGGLIISIIFSSLIVIISSVIGRVGISIISILFSALIPIASYVIVPLSNASAPSSSRSIKNNTLGLYLMKKNKINIDDPKEEIYLKGYNFLENRHLKRIDKNRESWYKYGRFFDFWYQWGRLFSMLEPNNIPREQLEFSVISRSSYEPIEKDKFIKEHGINLGKLGEDSSKELIYSLSLFSKQEIELKKEKVKFKNNGIVTYKNLIKNKTLIKNHIMKFGQAIDFLLKEDRDKLTKIWNDNPNSFEKDLGLEDGLINKYPKLGRIMRYQLILNYQKNILPTALEEEWSIFSYNKNNKKIYFIYLLAGTSEKVLKDINTIDASRTSYLNIIKNYKEEPWLKTIPTMLVWSFLTLSFLGLSILIRFKRDFR